MTTDEPKNNDEFFSPLVLRFLEQEFAKRHVPQDLFDQLVQEYGDQVYQELLYNLTRMHFEQEEARAHWNSILAHRDRLKELNGRDLGLRVAMADYFINIHPAVDNPILLEISLFLKKEEKTLRDELTGLFNRRFFNKMLQQEIDRARRFHEPMSLIILDVDLFKSYNDSYGHPAGDQALIEVAQVLMSSSRSIDHLVRYGGEEFTIILPRADRREAYIAAERHRQSMEAHWIGGLEERRLTISAGLATFPIDATDGLDLLDKADQALYQAKRAGRNRVRSSTISEQREFPRFAVDLSLVFREGPAQPLARALNLSLGGMYCKSSYAPDPGQEVGFKLLSGDTPLIDLQGECLRIQEDRQEPDTYYLAFIFKPETDKDKRSVRELLALYSDRPPLD